MSRRPLRPWQYVLLAALLGFGAATFAQDIWDDRDAIGQVPRAASVRDLAPELADFQLVDDSGTDMGGTAQSGSTAESFTYSSEAEWVQTDRTVRLIFRRYEMLHGKRSSGSGVERASRDLEEGKPREATSHEAAVAGMGNEAFEFITLHPASSEGVSAHLLVRVQNVAIHIRYNWGVPGTDKDEVLQAARGIAAAAISRLRTESSSG